MSDADPAKAAEVPSAPDEETERVVRKPMLGWTYWAGLTFGLVCVLLGAVVGVWGSRLVPPEGPLPPAELASPEGAAPASSLPAQPAPALEPPPALPQPFTSPPVDRAVAAQALAGLARAAEGSAPFAGQVEAAAEALPPGPALDSLHALAVDGAPTRAELAARFPKAAAAAVVAARDPGPRAGVIGRAGHLLTRLVTVRRTARLTGTDVDAVLARAERALAAGDLAGAQAEAEALPPPARAAMGAWRDGARRRLQVERSLSALREAALGPSPQPAGQGDVP